MKWLLLPLAIVASATPALAHDLYTGMRSPEGIPCCDNRDCAPADECRAPGGVLGYLHGGVCRPLPYNRFVPLPTPLLDDHRLHVCIGHLNGQPLVRCWTGPLGT